MRVFLAVELPHAIRATLTSGLDALKRSGLSARWVRAEGVHLTLKFLGELPEATVAELGRRVTEAMLPLGAVEVQLGGAGFFPTEHRARVAWIGGRASGMDVWAAALDEVAGDLGVAREERPFAVHLTLARLDHPWPPQVVERFKGEVGRWPLPAFVAREVTLFSSDLQPGGAVYRVVKRFAVGGA
jgi:RNA 2',3'-cyclic 3'-phosphodiesterase